MILSTPHGMGVLVLLMKPNINNICQINSHHRFCHFGVTFGRDGFCHQWRKNQNQRYCRKKFAHTPANVSPKRYHVSFPSWSGSVCPPLLCIISCRYCFRGIVRRWELRESDPVRVTLKWYGKLSGKCSCVVRFAKFSFRIFPSGTITNGYGYRLGKPNSPKLRINSV